MQNNQFEVQNKGMQQTKQESFKKL